VKYIAKKGENAKEMKNKIIQIASQNVSWISENMVEQIQNTS
jgi:hypothetical protein